MCLAPEVRQVSNSIYRSLTWSDVFLSPLKPPTKETISIEAVQSSLYYLHVNTAEDEGVKQSLEHQRRSEESSRPSVTIARKPLPDNSSTNHPLPPLPVDEPRYEPYRPPLPARPSVGSMDARGQQLRVETNTNPTDYRSLASLNGPSNIHDAAGDYALSPSIHENQAIYSSHSVQPSTARSDNRDTTLPTDNRGSNYPRQAPPPARDVPHYPSTLDAARQTDTSFSPVTIIRRDPSSGSQWNIGTITLLKPTFSGSNVKPVMVELTTPGYGRFAKGGWAETPHPASAGSDAESIRKVFEQAAHSPMSGISPDTSVTPFNRIVDFKKMAMSDLRRTAYQRTNSSESMNRMERPKANIEKNVLAFTSPWQGTCTFVNAIDGKTLKMKHTISSNSSFGEGITANIGELRFNLGWSILSNVKDARNRRKSLEPDKLPIPKLLESKKENFRKSFQHFRNKSKESFNRSRSANRSDEVLRGLSNVDTPTTNNLNDRKYPVIKTPGTEPMYEHHNDYPHTLSSAHPTSSEDNEDDTGRISLKLGRERAGGGFRGHSAKLGKLVIENEGLKMCDLVVGAAMGVWWQHYGG